MKRRSLSVRQISVLMFSLSAFGLMTSATLSEESKFFVKPVVEKKVAELPPAPLYWRLENFPTLKQAKDAEGPTSLAAEVGDNAWLFTLGLKGGSTAGGTKVVEIGPLPPISASEYLLRVNRAGGAPGTKSSVHTHPGSEVFSCAGRQARSENAPRRDLY